MIINRFSCFTVAVATLFSAASLCAQTGGADGLKAYTGARIIDGTGGRPVESGVIVVRAGRIEAIGPANQVRIPVGAETIALAGKTVIPGLINAHGHVGSAAGLRTGAGVYTRENVVQQLGLYARYGITTVASLGDDEAEGFRIRDAQEQPGLKHARLFVAGAIVTATTPEEARKQVQAVAASRANFVKIRVDDNLGTTRKMPPEVYRAVIDEAHKHSLPVAAHMYYLEDARDLLRSGVDFLAHSIRDKDVDAEFIALLKQRGVAYCPTLTREVSTYVYESTPDFFKDPFFAAEADPAVLRELENPTRQLSVKSNARAQSYKQALVMAQKNLKRLLDAGIPIAFGTDSGPPARFQGYFEHMEMDLMAAAGLSPMEILQTATGRAAASLKLKGLGTLEKGNWADFVVLSRNPLDEIRNCRTIESVWIAGNRVPGR
jgi:imidazolonepropionase-like amidohydrolase